MKNHNILLLVILLMSSSTLFAQSGPPGVPIDGGLLTIIGAGVAYGARKAYLSKKK